VEGETEGFSKKMIYRKIEDQKNSSLLEISAFNVDGGVAEYNLIIKITDTALAMSDQIECLNKACEKFIADEATDVTPVFKRFFIANGEKRPISLGNETDYAVSVIEQQTLDGSLVALWAYLRTDVEIGAINNNLFIASNNGYDHYWYVNGLSKKKGAEAETKEILSDYAGQLETVGITIAENCLRTWIFVDDIDNNYSAMVDARNKYFDIEGLTKESHYISSTGIACNMGQTGHIVQIDAYAVGGIDKEQITFLKGPTHFNPTFEYGVSFERGTAVDYGDRRHVIVSGTASIDNKGMIVGLDDINLQIRRMTENVGILLAEADCDFSDVAHIILYLRNKEDYNTVNAYFRENFGEIPTVILHAPVCRKGWLIEMECMAIKKGGSPEYPNL
jgi:enamine deaminase RidA (YjgF/YER057c/UK114 family)